MHAIATIQFFSSATSGAVHKFLRAQAFHLAGCVNVGALACAQLTQHPTNDPGGQQQQAHTSSKLNCQLQ
jgi:hypothetical protein